MALRDEPLGARRWFLLAALLVALRGLLVASLADVFFLGEELEKGAAGYLMLQDLPLAHHHLAYHAYEGGGFVASHLAALGFLVLGPSLLVHKLVALGWQLALLVLLVDLARRLFGPRAALWAGLLLALAPAAYQRLGLLDLGIHFEACVFVVLVLGLGARVVLGGDERPRTFALLGLATGLGTYYSYQVPVAAAGVLVLLAATGPRRLVDRRGLAGLAGTALGAAPLLVMATLEGGAVLDVHGSALVAGAQGPTNLEKSAALLRSLLVEAPPLELTTAWLWSLAFAVAAGVLARRPATRGGLLVVGGYLALFLVVYQSSGFVQGRVTHPFLLLRLVPAWLSGALLVAGALGALEERGAAARGLARALGGALLVAGLVGAVASARAGSPASPLANLGRLARFKGLEYRQYLEKTARDWPGDRRERLALLESVREPHPAWLRAEAAGALFREELLAEVGGDPAAAHARLREEVLTVTGGDGARLAEYELGLGPLLTVASGWDQGAALAALEPAPEPLRSRLAEALGRFGGGRYALPGPLAEAVARAEGSPAAAAYRRGLGRWLFQLHRLHPERVEAALEPFPEAVRADLREGAAAERAWRSLP